MSAMLNMTPSDKVKKIERIGRIVEENSEFKTDNALKKVTKLGKIVENVQKTPLTNINQENMSVSGRSALQEQRVFTEYNKPKTLEDVKVLRSIGEKSINQFTSDEIEKSQKWAYDFYNRMGVKSPFFRAWYGEWRAYDIKPAEIVTFSYGENPKINTQKRTVYNGELKHHITVDAAVFDDSMHYATINGDKKPILKLLGKIDEILAKGILLDTQISQANKSQKKGSTQFMHYLYTPVSVNGAPFIAKMTVEEYDLTSKTRAYNLQKIEMSDLSRAQFSQMIEKNRGKYAYKSDALSIAQLYEFVKSKDTRFVSAPEISPLLLNEDGTPKVLYHGTNAEFTVFKESTDGALGKGIYFVEIREYAQAFFDKEICAYSVY